MVKKGKEIGNEKLCAILSYILIGIIWYFVDEKMKKSKFAKFHAKQGLVLFIADLIVYVVVIIPFIGWIIAQILWLVILILLIIGIVNAANNKEKELPIIGSFASNFKF